MKTEKLNLDALRVQSFITKLSDKENHTIPSGDESETGYFPCLISGAGSGDCVRPITRPGYAVALEHPPIDNTGYGFCIHHATELCVIH